VIATAVVVWATSRYDSHWQYSAPLAVQAALPVTFLILALFLTESPTWLMTYGRRDNARTNLILLRGANIKLAESELNNVQLTMHTAQNSDRGPRFWEILSRKHLTQTFTASATTSLSQVGGQILVGTYSTVILIQSGIVDPFKITIIIFLL